MLVKAFMHLAQYGKKGRKLQVFSYKREKKVPQLSSGRAHKEIIWAPFRNDEFAN
jgi:hypothetical protein